MSAHLRREDGQTSIEFMAFMPYLFLAALLGWQLLLATTVINNIENAARAGSRAEGLGLDGEDRALEALPEWVRRTAQAEVGPGPGCADDTTGAGTRVVVCARVPVLVPGVGFPGLTFRRAAEFPSG